MIKKNLRNIIDTLLFRVEHHKNHISGLDGLRGYAIIFVLGAYTKAFSAGFGATGVWLFFILSGYLLTNNLIYAFRNKSYSTSIFQFYIKRFFRIIPSYFIVLIFYTFIVWGGNLNILLSHYTFEHAIWLFWTIKTELLFYLILPILVLSIIFFITKKYN